MYVYIVSIVSMYIRTCIVLMYYIYILHVRMYVCTYVCTSVATILLEVYHDNILLSRHVSRYITISAYCEIGRVRVVTKKY